MDGEQRAGILRQALALANARGAMVCSQRGDTEPMPDMNAALSFARRGR